MGSIKIVCILFLVLVPISSAFEYLVGGGQGWTLEGDPAVDSIRLSVWPLLNPNIKVGDVLRFKYPKGEYDVTRVDYLSGISCSNFNILYQDGSGDTSFTIDKPGFYAFVSTKQDGQQCLKGMRMPFFVKD